MPDGPLKRYYDFLEKLSLGSDDGQLRELVSRMDPELIKEADARERERMLAAYHAGQNSNTPKKL